MAKLQVSVPYTIKDRGIWYYRRRYPKDVAGWMRKNQLKVCLHTGDDQKLFERMIPVARRFDDEVTAAREAIRIEQERMELRATAERKVRHLPAEERATVEAGGGVDGLIRSVTDRVIANTFMRAADDIGGFTLDPDREYDRSEKATALGEAALDREDAEDNLTALRNERKALTRLGASPLLPDHVRHGETTYDTLPSGRRATENDGGAITLYEIAVRRRDVHKMGYHTSRNDFQAAELFEQLHGRVPLEQIKKDHYRRYRDVVEHMPRQKGPHTALPIDEQIARHAAGEFPPLTDRTREKWLKSIKKLMVVAIDDGFLDSDVWASIKVKRPKGGHASVYQESGRINLTAADVRKVFDWIEQKDGKGSDHWWIVQLAFHLGARKTEVCQLRPQDVNIKEGWIEFTDAGAGQSIKNPNSLRRIPLHPGLLKLGFAKFVERRSNEPFLFTVRFSV